VTARRATTLLVASVLVLATVTTVWLAGGPGEARVDLAGASVTTTTAPPGPPDAAPAAAPEQAGPDRPEAPAGPVPTPVRLGIPAIGVEADIVPVGLTDDGSMEIPGATEAGWYRLGSRPGAAAGSAVVAAHIDHEDQRGVFYDLRSLEPGAEVTVTDRSLGVHRFVVTERFQVDKDELPVEELFRTDGPAVLTLVTCGGAFDTGSLRYSDNIVVRAVPA
jgi:sortase (surface protein transpeptidase)